VISLLPVTHAGPQKGAATQENGASANEVAELSPIAHFTASPWFPHIVLLCCQVRPGPAGRLPAQNACTCYKKLH
jgi:hypothetical protein